MANFKLLPCLRQLLTVYKPTSCSFHPKAQFATLQCILPRLSIQCKTWHLAQNNVFQSTLVGLTGRKRVTLSTVSTNKWRWSAITFWRGMATKGRAETKVQRTAIIYMAAVGVFMVGGAYAGVPLYRMFCQATGRGGRPVAEKDTDKIETMKPVSDRTLTIRFNADVASSMQWNFHPQQSQVLVVPGETALAFYTACNPTDKPIIGISTYNIVPFEAGAYFNKIQCFCFEDQRLNPHEQVDMPVFFYIDPEFAEDPRMEHVDQITLSYTFFESKDGLNLPLPGYPQSPPKQPQA